MAEKLLLIILIAAHTSSCSAKDDGRPDLLGNFQVNKDLYLAHFDSKTDVDDIHSAAGVAMMLADSRFSEVNFHAVAGAYGIQEGLYVPANELFDLAFNEHWSDAHADWGKALAEVANIGMDTLKSGGTIWIAEAGQSDFSAALIRSIQEQLPDANVKSHVHIVQHSDWNEEVTTSADLAYVKATVSYHKIPDGNVTGNGTPGFRSDVAIDWRGHIDDARLTEIWETAIEIADTYNGVNGRYHNEAIHNGGFDFSDVAETAWIFGFDDLADASDFFMEFSH